MTNKLAPRPTYKAQPKLTFALPTKITNANSREPLKLSHYQDTPQRPNSCTKHLLSRGVGC